MSREDEHPASVPTRMERRGRRGATLVEAMLCIVLLGLTAAGISGLYASGLRSIEGGVDTVLLDSRLRSTMEALIARPFADVLAEGSGTEVVAIAVGQPALTWIAVPYDLDGDGTEEADAMRITVTAGGRALSMVVVDHGDSVRNL